LYYLRLYYLRLYYLPTAYENMLIYGHLISTFVLYVNMLIYGHLISTFCIIWKYVNLRTFDIYVCIICKYVNLQTFEGPSWSWSYSSWIYYLCNQCLSPLMLWDRIYIRARRTTLCDKVCQCFATCRWFSPDLPVSTTHKTEYNWNIVESGVKQHQTNEYLRYIIYFWEMIQILHEYQSNISIKHSMYKYD
jgi:sRNA-binding regulator protein Hfq